MPVHPDPTKKLFGFSLNYANGSTDYGLIVATCAETARLDLENATFAGIQAITITDQEQMVDMICSQYAGIAVFTTEFACN